MFKHDVTHLIPPDSLFQRAGGPWGLPGALFMAAPDSPEAFAPAGHTWGPRAKLKKNVDVPPQSTDTN
jgi:hypothetical protein